MVHDDAISHQCFDSTYHQSVRYLRTQETFACFKFNLHSTSDLARSVRLPHVAGTDISRPISRHVSATPRHKSKPRPSRGTKPISHTFRANVTDLFVYDFGRSIQPLNKM